MLKQHSTLIKGKEKENGKDYSNVRGDNRGMRNPMLHNKSGLQYN